MFIVHLNDVLLDGSNPTLLYGYGGFNLDLTPRLSSPPIPWPAPVVVHPVPPPRAARPYARAWRHSGMLST